MDLAAIRTKFAQLGIPLRWENDPTARAAALEDQRARRASLYVQHLDETNAFFTQFMANDPLQPPQGVAGNYEFVRPALQAPGLLTPLAQMLDRYVAPAVGFQLQGAPNAFAGTYEAYFDTQIFNGNAQIYEANRTAFLARYPVTASALVALAANFRNNIREACGRVIADRALIEQCYADRYPNLSITGLTRIVSSGSDFHKGGRQVLFLTFSISYSHVWTRNDELKVVYKPADLDIDCRLLGDSAAVNRALGQPGQPFMQASLVESFNGWVAGALNAQPARPLVPLPTYRIIPRNPVSAAPAGAAPVPVQDAYGYMEFLSHATTGSGWGLYPWGASDFAIFGSQRLEPIVRAFYRQMGEWAALAVTLSLWDLHIENVRARAYQGNLIDLEVALTGVSADLSATELVKAGPEDGNIGGITGGRVQDADDFVWWWNAGPPRRMERLNELRPRQNRLYAYRPNLRRVGVEWFSLLQGLEDGLALLGANGAELTGWVAARDRALVRVLPLGTRDWQVTREQIYLTPGQWQADADTTVDAVLAMDLAHWFGQFTAQQQQQPPPQPPPLPDFVVAQPQVSRRDLLNLDIPAFYHRIGSADIVDSAGTVVAVPPTVTIAGAPQPTGVGRVTYFPGPPTTANIQAQVQQLQNAAAHRFQALLTDLLNAGTYAGLGTARPAAAAVRLVPLQ